MCKRYNEQKEEIAKLKTMISFERDQHQAEVDQLLDDIKFLRSKLPNL
jgi:hypothetical protein